MQKKEYVLELSGRKIVAEFSDLADQANGSVLLKSEGTVVLATAVISGSGKDNPGFFNLTVDYLEKYYAAGAILGSQFMRREGRPSDEAILSSRVIDRTIRPLFEHHIKNAVQVIVTVLALGKADPGILGINAASLALGVSNIPWGGPVSAAHIGRIKGEKETKTDIYLPNESGESPYELDLTVCGKDGNVNMIEAMAPEESEEGIGKALEMALEQIAQIESFQKKIIAEIGKEKQKMEKPGVPEEAKKLFEEKIASELKGDTFGPNSKQKLHELEHTWKEIVEEKYPLRAVEDSENLTKRFTAEDYFFHQVDKTIHEAALKENRRADGRKMDEVRNLYAKAGGVSEVLHGSGIFYRGETHVLSVLTLGGPDDAHVLDGMEVKGDKRFMHHYNFPPYSSGETGRVGNTNRREMGHGILAEKALLPVIPDKLSFPYTIRLVSESMASNGSTSQASICASTLALMDGGVPIKAPVAGIAMGLMMSEAKSRGNEGIDPSFLDSARGQNLEYKILTDIQGPEDHHGDMDFKVAGTKEGVTAIQLDVKVDGIPLRVLKEAMLEAKKARVQILEVITKEIEKPRADISPNAPKILITKIKVSQIGLLIGPGGKTVNGIKDATGAEITIEDDGSVYITGKNGSAEKALEKVLSITHEFEVGEVLEGEVVKVAEFGAFVEIGPDTDGMVHISEIAPFRIEKVGDFLKEGMRVPVKIIAVDKERGRIGLSIKEANPALFNLKKPDGVKV